MFNLSQWRYVAGELLTRAGAHSSAIFIRRLEMLLNYLETGRWLKANGFVVPRRSKSRDEVFEAVVREVKDNQVLYLEFGVCEGETMRYWSGHLMNPRSCLHGFDSFEGLPESWNIWRPKGCFSTAGKIPEILDARVTFFKGWFHETLPDYMLPAHEQLVINIDSDLYESAKLVLTKLKASITIGTYLYFDEFHDIQHELKAFREFLADTGARFEIVAAFRDLSAVMFRRIT